MDRYFPPAPAGQQQKQPEKPFDLSGLRDLNANGTIRIGSLKANNLKATNVRLDLKANGGRVDLNPLTANLYQGTLASAVSINAAPATPAFAVKHNMNGVSIAPLLKDLANNDTLEGRGNVTLDVTTQGNTAERAEEGAERQRRAQARRRRGKGHRHRGLDPQRQGEARRAEGRADAAGRQVAEDRLLRADRRLSRSRTGSRTTTTCRSSRRCCASAARATSTSARTA